MRRFLILALLSSGVLLAQMPKGIYAWWSRPEIARNLNLTPAQREQIRAAVQQFRPHLLNVRVAVNQAEQALAEQFNRNPVDPGKTNEAIERLVDARSDLTRTLTQLSLKLRLVLTEQQWEELQRRRPNQQDAEPDPQNKSDRPSPP
jgi:Spy/CpxP family protein refolding chaperone